MKVIFCVANDSFASGRRNETKPCYKVARQAEIRIGLTSGPRIVEGKQQQIEKLLFDLQNFFPPYANRNFQLVIFRECMFDLISTELAHKSWKELKVCRSTRRQDIL